MYNSLAALFGLTGQDLSGLSGSSSGNGVNNTSSNSDFEKFLARAVPLAAAEIAAQEPADDSQRMPASEPSVQLPEQVSSQNQIPVHLNSHQQHSVSKTVSHLFQESDQLESPVQVPVINFVSIETIVGQEPRLIQPVHSENVLIEETAGNTNVPKPEIIIPFTNSISYLDDLSLSNIDNDKNNYVLELQISSKYSIGSSDETLVIPARIVSGNTTQSSGKNNGWMIAHLL